MFANRISYAFGFHGPSLVLDTYCSSSLVALHYAAQDLRSGVVEGAVVGGVNLLLNPLVTLQMMRAGTLSPDGTCKSFDSKGWPFKYGHFQFPSICITTQKRKTPSSIYNFSFNCICYGLCGCRYSIPVYIYVFLRISTAEIGYISYRS
jgi:hypothetical protein